MKLSSDHNISIKADISKRQDKPVWRISRFESLYRRTGFFHWGLKAQPALMPLRLIQDPWRGNSVRGGHILQGNLPAQTSDPIYHEFGWLRDIREYGGGSARLFARDQVMGWLRQNHSWNATTWRPDYIGQRLSNLLFSYDWFASSADDDVQQDCASLISEQLACLSRDWQRLTNPAAQIKALKGLILGQAVLRQSATDVALLADILLPKIKGQLHQDGGHRSRQPETHLALLRDAFECRTAYAAVGLPENPALEELINRMAAIARMWRHGDGKFAHFQGAGQLEATQIDEVLQRCGSRGRTLQQAPHTGYIRMASGRNTLIIDAGGPADSNGHTVPSSLAFEFSVASARFIVNSGQFASDERLISYLEKTAAHSTLTLDGFDSSHMDSGRIAQMANVEVGPTEDGQLAIASHNGFETSHGIIHHRQIYLANGGGNLRGSDRLEYTGAPGEIPEHAVIRFHLHPRVSAAKFQDGRVVMKIRGQKAGWIFKSRGGQVRLENSLYIDEGRRTTCQQIVLMVPLSTIRAVGDISANWSFTRATSLPSTRG